jgi:hypothetical protein
MVAAKRPIHRARAIRFTLFLPAKQKVLEVDPTRLELVTSAMRRLSVLPDAIVKPSPAKVIAELTMDRLPDKLTV